MFLAGVMPLGAQINQSRLAEAEASSDPDNIVVVVTANRTSIAEDRAAASVTVIDRATIERQQIRTLTDALRQVPGLALAQSGTPGQVTGFFMRGTVTRHTPVLINGVPLPYDASGDFNIARYGLDNVERIEVVRGPMSSLYGGPALGGVINIITRSGAGVSAHSGSVSFEAGSFQTFRESIQARGSEGPFDYSVEASRLDSDFQRDNNETRLSNLNSSLGWTFLPHLRLDVGFLYNLLDTGSPNTVVTPDPAANLLQETWQVAPRLVWETTDWWEQSLTFRHAQQRQMPARFTGFFAFNGKRQVDTDFVEYQSTFRPLENFTFVAGTNFEDIRYSRRNNALGGAEDQRGNRTNTSLFVGGYWEPLADWLLSANFRQDLTTDYGNSATWRVGSSYVLPQTQTVVHASYGTAFSPPSVLNVLQNPAVRSERSQGWEAGLRQSLWEDRIMLSWTWFENRIEDLISFPPPAFLPTNVQEARAQGFETGVQIRPVDQWTLSANYTYTHQKNLNTQTRTVRIPRHALNLSTDWEPIPGLVFTAGANWVADREDFLNVPPFNQPDLEDYFIVRLAASWQIHRHVRLLARMENVFDEQYEEVRDYPALDRAIYGGFEISF